MHFPSEVHVRSRYSMDDDPWANAWNDQPHVQTPVWSFTTLDKQPPESRQPEPSSPSWQTGTGASWNEPSSPVHNSLWSQSTGLWASSSHTNVESSSKYTTVLEQEDPTPSQVASTIHVPSSPNASHDDLSDEPESTPNDARSGSPDAFGTFEEAVSDAPWSLSHASGLNAPDWGSSWDSESTSRVEPRPDEWELASREKESRTSEQLAPLLRKAQEFAEQLWPTPELSDQQRTLDEQSLNLQGLEAVDGLAAAAAKLIPQDLTLPPAVRFNKTSVAKHMAEAIRLTKHAPLTRLSPLSLSVVPKGSLAWEAAVKAEPDTNQDDAPPGWRILEKKPEEPTSASSDVAKGKKIGGLLSFLGRRAPTPPLDRKRETSVSPAFPITSNKPASPTQSVYSVKPPPTLVDPTTTDKAIPTLPPVPQIPIRSTAKPSTENSSTPQPEINQNEASSAVSRFLGRLSRAKGSQPSGPQISKPLSLSSNDLVFLSEMGSNASDGTYKPISQDTDCLDMISSSPPTILLPPLSPPPRLPTPQAFVGVVKTDIIQKVKTNGHTSRPDPLHNLAENGNLQSNIPVGSFSFPLPSEAASGASNIGAEEPRIAALKPIPEPGSSYLLRPPVSNAGLSPTTSKFPQVMMAKSEISSFSSPSLAQRLPPPPSSRSHTPLVPPPVNKATRSSTPVSFISAPSRPLPNVSQSHATVASVSSSATQDFDDFSDFLSQGPVSTVSFAADTSFSSVSSNRSLVSRPNQINDPFDFDDFDDFVSSSIRTPSPPRPPAKTPASMVKRLPAMPEQSTRHSKEKKKAFRAAEHSRTLSLVETAASRPGRWPAPPSPLPHLLPPPMAVASDLITVNFFGEPPERTHAGSTTAEGLRPFVSSPTTVNKGNISGQPTSLVLPSLGLVPSPTPPPLPAVLKPIPPLPAPTKVASSATTQPPAPTSKTTGGLSAQDLLFFEGI